MISELVIFEPDIHHQYSHAIDIPIFEIALLHFFDELSGGVATARRLAFSRSVKFIVAGGHLRPGLPLWV